MLLNYHSNQIEIIIYAPKRAFKTLFFWESVELYNVLTLIEPYVAVVKQMYFAGIALTKHIWTGPHFFKTNFYCKPYGDPCRTNQTKQMYWLFVIVSCLQCNSKIALISNCGTFVFVLRQWIECLYMYKPCIWMHAS